MIRISSLDASAVSRRRLLRMGFAATLALAATEIAVTLVPFIRVTRFSGLGAKVALPHTKDEILQRFAATNDEPILFAKDKFFLIHAPEGIAAAYRKCTHLGCAVPFARDEDRFHCPCHQSVYDKRTALLISGPAPRGLDLFHMTEEAGTLVVDTNPFELMVRDDNRWDPAHVEVVAS